MRRAALLALLVVSCGDAFTSANFTRAHEAGALPDAQAERSVPGSGGAPGTGGARAGKGGSVVIDAAPDVVSIDARADAESPPTGGMPGAGGRLATGGRPGTGGIVTTGGALGSGGVPGTGGLLGTGGACAPKEKLCAGQCVSVFSAATGCGQLGCSACSNALPPNSSLFCNPQAACDFDCNVGFNRRGASCLTCGAKSCSEQGLECGSATDLCGAPLFCGSCSSGLSCVSGHCECRPTACPFCAGTPCCKTSTTACGCALVPGSACN